MLFAVLIWWYFTMRYPIPYPTLSYPSYPTISYPILPYLVVPYSTLPYAICYTILPLPLPVLLSFLLFLNLYLDLYHSHTVLIYKCNSHINAALPCPAPVTSTTLLRHGYDSFYFISFNSVSESFHSNQLNDAQWFVTQWHNESWVDSNKLTTQNRFLNFDSQRLTIHNASRILTQINSRLKKLFRICSALNDAILFQLPMPFFGHSTLLLTCGHKLSCGEVAPSGFLLHDSLWRFFPGQWFRRKTAPGKKANTNCRRIALGH